MPRYIEQLTENTTPATGDWLWIVDVSALATDQDRKLSVGKLALLATANTFTANQRINAFIGVGVAPTQELHIQGATPRVYISGTSAVNAGDELARMSGLWNANVVFDLRYLAGDDTINQDNGRLQLRPYKSAGNPAIGIVINEFGWTGVNVLAPLAQLHVDQERTAGGIPALLLDQADLSEGFIDYVGTSAANSTGPITTWTMGNTVQGHVAVEINGTRRWIPFYDAPTS